MKSHSHYCLWIAVLLVSCDETKNSGRSESVGKSEPKSTHANRPPRDTAASLKKKHRAALEAAMNLEPGAARDTALAGVVRDALRSAPEISAEAFRQLSPASPVKTQLLQDCAKFFVERKPEEAFAWADTLELAKDVTAAKIQIARLLADTDPARAMNSLSNAGMEIGKPGGFAATMALRRWVSKAPADAAAWAIASPPGDTRKSGIKVVVSQWVRTDPPSALSWLDKLDDPAVRQEASRAMAEGLVQTPPPLRDSLLQSANPTTRGELERQMEEISKQPQQLIRPFPPVPANPTESTVPDSGTR